MVSAAFSLLPVNGKVPAGLLVAFEFHHIAFHSESPGGVAIHGAVYVLELETSVLRKPECGNHFVFLKMVFAVNG